MGSSLLVSNGRRQSLSPKECHSGHVHTSVGLLLPHYEPLLAEAPNTNTADAITRHPWVDRSTIP
jgi:hypothetical protein